MHDLFFPFYSVGIERKVNTGTFTNAKIYNIYEITKVQISHETTRIYLRRTSSEQQRIVDKVVVWYQMKRIRSAYTFADCSDSV